MKTRSEQRREECGKDILDMFHIHLFPGLLETCRSDSFHLPVSTKSDAILRRDGGMEG